MQLNDEEQGDKNYIFFFFLQLGAIRFGDEYLPMDPQ